MVDPLRVGPALTFTVTVEFATGVNVPDAKTVPDGVPPLSVTICQLMVPPGDPELPTNFTVNDVRIPEVGTKDW